MEMPGGDYNLNPSPAGTAPNQTHPPGQTASPISESSSPNPLHTNDQHVQIVDTASRSEARSQSDSGQLSSHQVPRLTIPLEQACARPASRRMQRNVHAPLKCRHRDHVPRLLRFHVAHQKINLLFRVNLRDTSCRNHVLPPLQVACRLHLHAPHTIAMHHEVITFAFAPRLATPKPISTALFRKAASIASPQRFLVHFVVLLFVGSPRH